MTLTEDLRRVLHAAASEPGRAERELSRQIAEDLDELAARRKQHAYLTKREADEAEGLDRYDREIQGGPF